MKINQKQLFSMVSKNRSIFLGASQELDEFIKKLPNRCAACYYKKIAEPFSQLVEKNKEELQDRCSFITMCEVEIS